MPSLVLQVTSWERSILQGSPRYITLSTAEAQSPTDTKPDGGGNFTRYLILALFSRYSHPQLPHTVQLQKSAPKASKEDPNQWISRSILTTNICLYLILVLVLHNKTRANTGLRYQLLNVPLSTYLGHNPLITKFQGCLSIYYYIIYIYYSIYRYQIMSLTVATSQIQKWVWLWSKACLFFSEKIFIFSMIKNYNVNGYFCNTFQNGV